MKASPQGQAHNLIADVQIWQTSWKHECLTTSKRPQCMKSMLTKRLLLNENHIYGKATITRILTWKLCLNKVYSDMKAHIFTKFTFTWRLQLHEEQQLLIVIITRQRTPKIMHESCKPTKTRKALMLYTRQKHELLTWTKSTKLANTREPMITRRSW